MSAGATATSWLEWTVVVLLVVGSALFALWRLLPAAWRVRLQVRLGWRVRDAACGCESCPATPPTDHGPTAR